jgi:hypothetical protein
MSANTVRHPIDRRTIVNIGCNPNPTTLLKESTKAVKVQVQLSELQALAEADPRKAAARERDVRRMERRAQAIELRRAGLTYHAIGTALGITEAGACKLVKKALKATVRTAADTLREQELRDLERGIAALDKIIDAVHPLVSGGSIVHDIVRDGLGNPVIDPRTSEPLRMPVANSRPVVEAIEVRLKYVESRRRLLGTDAPKQVSVTTDGDAARVFDSMDQAQREQAVRVVWQRLRRSDAIDVTPLSGDSVRRTSEGGEANESADPSSEPSSAEGTTDVESRRCA